MAQQINLQNPATFKHVSLTPEQFSSRYHILSNLEETLDANGQTLSPRSQKELAQLVDLHVRNQSEILSGIYPICRLSTPHYFVKFPDSQSYKIEKYKTLQTQIDELPRTTIGVLQAVQPGVVTWFNEAIRVQSQAVFKSDFMDSLRHAFIAGVSLLRSSALIVKEPKIFKEVVSIYGSAYDLYQDQVEFNRSVEMDIINNAMISHDRLESLHRETLSICGSDLSPKDEILQRCDQVSKIEAQEGLEVYSRLE
jgi:hypothetical protein